MIAIHIHSRTILALAFVVVLGGCGGKGTTVATTTVSPATRVGADRVYRVPSRSMEPTVRIGERVEAAPGQPRIGDIVIFHPPVGAQQEVCGSAVRVERGGAACSGSVPRESRIRFVKRIVAGPGDMISVVRGHVIRNGKREADLIYAAAETPRSATSPCRSRSPSASGF